MITSATLLASASLAGAASAVDGAGGLRGGAPPGVKECLKKLGCGTSCTLEQRAGCLKRAAMKAKAMKVKAMKTPIYKLKKMEKLVAKRKLQESGGDEGGSPMDMLAGIGNAFGSIFTGFVHDMVNSSGASDLVDHGNAVVGEVLTVNVTHASETLPGGAIMGVQEHTGVDLMGGIQGAVGDATELSGPAMAVAEEVDNPAGVDAEALAGNLTVFAGETLMGDSAIGDTANAVQSLIGTGQEMAYNFVGEVHANTGALQNLTDHLRDGNIEGVLNGVLPEDWGICLGKPRKVVKIKKDAAKRIAMNKKLIAKACNGI